ncbi:hypothetical protein ACFE04_018711 [Oxalis oulophora]
MEFIAMEVGKSIISTVISKLVNTTTNSDFLNNARKQNVDAEINKWHKTMTKINVFTADSQGASSSSMRALIPSCCTSFSLSNAKFGSKLKELTTKFEKIVKDKNDLGLIEKSNVKFEKRPESTPLGIEEGFFESCNLSYDVLHKILLEFKCLKVLSLQHYTIRELPNNIDVLKLLRYLDLSWSHITRLPNSVDALYNLETLILYQCSCLVELPKNIINFADLHKLDLTFTRRLLEMPSRIGSLTKLQTLSKFIVSKGDKHQIRELQGLTRLRGKLSIYGLENVQDIKDVRCANLKGKKGLDNIALIWSSEF